MLYLIVGVDFLSTFKVLNPNMKVRLRIIRARHKFCIISDNPNVGVGSVDCSLYTRRNALKKWLPQEKNERACIYSRGVKLFETLTKTFFFPAK